MPPEALDPLRDALRKLGEERVALVAYLRGEKPPTASVDEVEETGAFDRKAFEEVEGLLTGTRGDGAACRYFLDLGDLHAQRGIGWLRPAEGEPGHLVVSSYKSSREEFRRKTEEALEGAPAPGEGAFPRVVAHGSREFHLRCDICGGLAALFFIGPPPFAFSSEARKEVLLCDGLTSLQNFPRELAEKVFPLLESGRVGEVHELLLPDTSGCGLDAWCPPCGKVYCRRHLRLEQVWDGSFYEETLGTCPRGHKRTVDD